MIFLNNRNVIFADIQFIRKYDIQKSPNENFEYVPLENIILSSCCRVTYSLDANSYVYTSTSFIKFD
jgi:hypothetical protein